MLAGPSAHVVALEAALVGLMLGAVLVALSLPAAADPTNEEYSEYEKETVDEALARHEAHVDPAPIGKRISNIEIDVLDVVEERDPAPNFLNYLHANTKDYVIRRELLFAEGQRYDPAVIQETERNLRGIRQESLVLIVPLVTKRKDSVRVLVIVKDIWSLRLNSDYRIKNAELEYLLLQPAEENLAGTHRQIAGLFVYEPDTLTFGGSFVDPRLAGTAYRWSLGANVIVNRDSGDPEGSSGSASYSYPLYSTSQKWAWGASASWLKEITRRFIGLELRTFDADVTPEDDKIPYIYDTEVVSGSVSFTRSYGYAVKNDFTVGASASRSVFRAEDLSAFDPAAAAEFEQDAVPFGETRNGPYVIWDVYLNRYMSIIDAETMGLQETYLLGPELLLRFQPISRAFGSTRDVLNYTATAAYTQALGTGYVRLYGSADIEADLAHASAAISDSLLHTGIRMTTPPFFIGRLVYDGTFVYRPDNFSNSTLTLGGDTRLRGYPSRAFIGENMFASNIEFRSRTFQLWTILVRGSLFYDVADAFFDGDIDPKHGAGFGVQVLLPQLGRAVIRADWGFALSPEFAPPSVFEGLLLTYRQAFGVPAAGSSGVDISAR